MSLPLKSTAAFMLLALAAPTLADEIVLIPGTTVKQAAGNRVRGTVQSEALTEVVVKLGANTINVPTDQIISIRYDGQPASLALAESNESGGQLAKAAELYKKAAVEADGKPFIVQTAQYKHAEVTADLAMADPSKASEAVTLLEAFVKTNPASRHTGPALDTLARLQLQKGDFPQAEKTIASLSAIPTGADRAAILRAKILARKGDHAKAVAELDRLIKAAPAGSLRQTEARLAKAESLAALKQFGAAETDLRSVIKTLPAEDVAGQSSAYNTLGDSLRAAGRPKDALLAYLHTDLLFSKDKEQHPRALSAISQLWRELKRDDRADDVFARLKQEYPQSPWLTAKANP